MVNNIGCSLHIIRQKKNISASVKNIENKLKNLEVNEQPP